jgi:hypothetical protein
MRLRFAIAAENKPSNIRAVKIIIEQLSEPNLSYRGIGFVVEQLDTQFHSWFTKAGGSAGLTAAAPPRMWWQSEPTAMVTANGASSRQDLQRNRVTVALTSYRTGWANRRSNGHLGANQDAISSSLVCSCQQTVAVAGPVRVLLEAGGGLFGP